jgi:hypothetical protein
MRTRFRWRCCGGRERSLPFGEHIGVVISGGNTTRGLCYLREAVQSTDTAMVDGFDAGLGQIVRNREPSATTSY